MEITELFPEKMEMPSLKSKSKKVLIFALARDSKGIEAKNYSEVLSNKLPDKFSKPLVKVFRDVDWRDFQRRLRCSTEQWDYLATCAVFIDGTLIGDENDFKEFLKKEYSVKIDQRALRRFAQMDILDKIGKHPFKSYVFFDVKIHEKKAGRMIFEIDSDVLPESSNVFLELCCYQKLILPDDIKHRDQFQNALIKRIVKDSWVEVESKFVKPKISLSSHSEPVPNRICKSDYKHESSTFKHERRGTLSLSFDEHRQLISSHFIITLDETRWMDTNYRPIGRLVDGEHVLHMVENVRTAYERPLLAVTISHCGILYSPTKMATAEYDQLHWINKGKMLNSVREDLRAAVRRRLRQKPLDFKEARSDEIEFGYSVPRETVEERYATQWDPETQQPSSVKNVAVTVMPKQLPQPQLDFFGPFAVKNADDQRETEPFSQDSDRYNYYRFSNRDLKKMTPRLLLAWAQGIDCHYKIKNIEKAIEEFLDNAIKIFSGGQDDSPHPMDAPSDILFPERYFKCLYSLPTELLVLLREMVDDYFIRVEPPRCALSDDVISAHLLAIVDVTRRMIESTTDVVQNLENFDLIADMIDELIIKKVEVFENQERQKPTQNQISPTPSSLNTDVGAKYSTMR